MMKSNFTGSDRIIGKKGETMDGHRIENILAAISCIEAHLNEKMEQQSSMDVPTELLPRCPHCSKTMTMNLRSDGKFVEDEG